MFMGFVYCIVFIYLMSWFAEYIAWACIVLTQIGLVATSIFMFSQYLAAKSGNSVTDGTLVDNVASKE